jgi:hypothetical protein
MPSGKSYINFIYINLAFVLYIVVVFYYTQVSVIKSNWSKYRCNPIYMPLADNIQSNFVYCIQSMQSNYMGYLLEPLTFITSSIGSLLGNFLEEINLVRAMFNKVRIFISTIIQSVFGVLLNLVIEFQKINISIIDLIGKTIGIMTTLMYTIDGSIKTMNSTWNGPPGQLVKALGKCFHPLTKLKLHNGIIKEMKDIDLGDKLIDGSIVEAVMKIDNKREQQAFYIIPKSGVDLQDLYVTGSHYILDNKLNKFIKVKDYSNAFLSTNKSDYFTCLITSNHNIKIGKELFWDWEDYLIK